MLLLAVMAVRLTFPRGRALTGWLLYGRFNVGGSLALIHCRLFRVHAGLGQYRVPYRLTSADTVGCLGCPRGAIMTSTRQRGRWPRPQVKSLVGMPDVSAIIEPRWMSRGVRPGVDRGGRLGRVARRGGRAGVAGDINADGHADVAVGEPFDSDMACAVHVFYGTAGGLVANTSGTARDDQLFTQDTPGFPVSASPLTCSVAAMSRPTSTPTAAPISRSPPPERTRTGAW